MLKDHCSRFAWRVGIRRSSPEFVGIRRSSPHMKNAPTCLCWMRTQWRLHCRSTPAQTFVFVAIFSCTADKGRGRRFSLALQSYFLGSCLSNPSASPRKACRACPSSFESLYLNRKQDLLSWAENRQQLTEFHWRGQLQYVGLGISGNRQSVQHDW